MARLSCRPVTRAVFLDRDNTLIANDNYVDVLLGSTKIAKRPPLSDTNEIPKDTFQAEHGLSILVKVETGGESHTVLLDTGHNEASVLFNMEKLHVDTASLLLAYRRNG